MAQNYPSLLAKTGGKIIANGANVIGSVSASGQGSLIDLKAATVSDGVISSSDGGTVILPTGEKLDPKAYLTKFVSLGDNCEFGFFQHSHGIEQSSLLRWALLPPESLISGLQGNFADLFLFENLKPLARSMVIDSKYGIGFHSKMTSENLVFKQSEEERKVIHAAEITKHQYLAKKLLDLMAQDDIVFVYKRSGPLNKEAASLIQEQIARRGKGQLLMVYDEGETEIGDVVVEDNYMHARIDRVAPQARANDFSSAGWETITSKTVSSISSRSYFSRPETPEKSPGSYFARVLSFFGIRR